MIVKETEIRDFGEWMKSKLKEKGISKKDYSKLINFHPNSLYRWEQGCQFPALDVAAQIATSLGAEIIIRERIYGE